MVSKLNIKVIGFEGLHRAGKSTQIALLKEKLESEGNIVLSLRGDGVRNPRFDKGNPSFSKWWEENQDNLRRDSTTVAEMRYKADLVAQRLNREINVAGKRTQRSLNNGQNGYLLLDRTFISRYFVLSQGFPTIEVEESLKIPYPNKREVRQIVPDLTFVINVDKATLLLRCKDDKSPKRSFREGNIHAKYDLFQETLKNVDCIKYHVEYLDGRRNINEVHLNVMSSLLENGIYTLDEKR